MQAKSHLKLVAPAGKKRAVALPQRRPNADYRKREYLTPAEVDKLIEAAKGNRYGQRDATMILTAYRHALRASETCDLEWSAIDFARADTARQERQAGLASDPRR
jgi:integrase